MEKIYTQVRSESAAEAASLSDFDRLAWAATTTWAYTASTY
jgi:hypothetical protein